MKLWDGVEGPVVPGYSLLERVGSGASGEVWRARRRADDLLVALKVVRARDGDLGTALREAAVLSRVRHQHLLHLYDVVPLPDPQGRPAGLGLAVQFAAGGSLAQVLAARRLLSLGELVTLLSPVAGALADLHRVGVVHGDVSPGNVLFLSDGMPMLADVGVSRLVGERLDAVHGTDGMVAPEVVEGFPPGPEADVYGLGALAWLCLSGEQPGWVGTRADLADLAPELPDAARDLVQRCLAPEPEDRPDAEEVAVAVLALAPPEPIEVAPDADPGLGLTRRLRAAARADDEADAVEQVGRRSHLPRHRSARGTSEHGGTGRRRPLWAGAAVLLVTVAVGCLGVAVTSWPSGEAQDRVAPLAPAAPTAPAAEASPGAGTGSASASASTSSVSVEPSAPGAGVLDPVVDDEPDPVSLMQELVDARALAWESGDPGRLRAALASGSPALGADTADLELAAAERIDYADVGFRVVSADTRGEEDGRLRVSGVVERAPLQISTRDGIQETPAVEEEVTWELRRADGRWRIWSWG
ncbi:serine/threonine-protein kinase [Ornithinimicrobium sediminis]|uniref:serine/threonine-protein kinase n=1 Tax=Ornithinimicrobium sediminis TaxID=2904603 RepID=UPI001E38DBBB|nr:serine/threonine-protein kinase [Ornithinimicrobium sediminis]MCE0488058.1 serine/threonine protein kinase [Ornithinimicrobium sediminis]